MHFLEEMLPTVVAEVDWSLLGERLFSPDSAFLRAIVTTIGIAVVAEISGVILGLVAALSNMSRWFVPRAVAYGYVLFFRGTPLIVQIFFIYYGTNLFLGFDLFPREIDFGLFSLSGAIVAGTLALSLNEGAYMSEIVRAGILSVDRGQTEAAQSVGMTRALTMRRIVLPQAARIIVPPLGNQFNAMIKNTSLLAFIGVYDMFFDAQLGYSRTYKPVEFFAAVAVWYLFLTSCWYVIQWLIERRLGVSERADASPRRRGMLRPFLTGRGAS